nr:probable E3 SUMO-protein ligase RNF212 isoform X3 [Equus asinus]XP_044623953.1 probable E3 SUMO-protein ligase RNF212 isoform X3 [Equus asinus]XP_044623954.1 probable E3 SUMO-protein ligase RNF212 isoform X3 [Equus asinus]XP_044623955.1 probable E3 SUMO-protein ligase RNF212 isoform X3 [Equus asinus]XP_044623956.1 probable E3 SUMO-protein ligase RNF212 isoform X3 [Equus asinus]
MRDCPWCCRTEAKAAHSSLHLLGKKDECVICKVPCRTVLLSKHTDSDIQALFMGIDGLCKKYSKETSQVPSHMSDLLQVTGWPVVHQAVQEAAQERREPFTQPPAHPASLSSVNSAAPTVGCLLALTTTEEKAESGSSQSHLLLRPFPRGSRPREHALTMTILGLLACPSAHHGQPACQDCPLLCEAAFWLRQGLKHPQCPVCPSSSWEASQGDTRIPRMQRRHKASAMWGGGPPPSPHLQWDPEATHVCDLWEVLTPTTFRTQAALHPERSW